MQAEGDKGGVNGLRIQRQMQVCSAGRRYKWRRMEGGRCGQCPGGRLYVPGKEVGRECDREVLQERPLLMRGGSRGEKIKLSRKRLRQVGQGARIICNH